MDGWMDGIWVDCLLAWLQWLMAIHSLLLLNMQVAKCRLNVTTSLVIVRFVFFFTIFFLSASCRFHRNIKVKSLAIRRVVFCLFIKYVNDLRHHWYYRHQWVRWWITNSIRFSIHPSNPSFIHSFHINIIYNGRILCKSYWHFLWFSFDYIFNIWIEIIFFISFILEITKFISYHFFHLIPESTLRKN